MNAHGKISLAGFSYRVGATYAGEPVEVVAAGGLVDIVPMAWWWPPMPSGCALIRLTGARGRLAARRARDATAGLTVTRLADGSGNVSFAGTSYGACRRWARQPIDVTIVAGSVQLSRDGKVIRVHPIRHDRSRELGAFANPNGRPRRKNSALGNIA